MTTSLKRARSMNPRLDVSMIYQRSMFENATCCNAGHKDGFLGDKGYKQVLNEDSIAITIVEKCTNEDICYPRMPEDSSTSTLT